MKFTAYVSHGKFLHGNSEQASSWKPIQLYRYLKDTILLWLHAKEEFRRYHRHLNSIHQTSVYQQKQKRITHCNVNMPWPSGSTMALYRKPTYTDLLICHFSSSPIARAYHSLETHPKGQDHM
jgi:thiamine kinase-like enzyme